MTYAKRKPSLWVTWVARELAGEQTCAWATWFKAHFGGYHKVSSGFDEAEWRMAHTELLARIQGDAQKEFPSGKITVEEDNSFWLGGQIADLGGKPDLVIELPDRVIIDDAKTGQPKGSDVIQMMLYMYALPRVFERFKGKQMHARLKYRSGKWSPELGPGPPRIVEVPGHSVDQIFIGRVGEVIKRAAADAPLIKSPSVSSCRWCDIPSEDCPERMEGQITRGYTDEF
jgi:hypothetical protein